MRAEAPKYLRQLVEAVAVERHARELVQVLHCARQRRQVVLVGLKHAQIHLRSVSRLAFSD